MSDRIKEGVIGTVEKGDEWFWMSICLSGYRNSQMNRLVAEWVDGGLYGWIDYRVCMVDIEDTYFLNSELGVCRFKLHDNLFAC